MEVVHPRCCGLDIHKDLIVACALTPGASQGSAKEIRSFGTMTPDLLALGDWLSSRGVTQVAMESTGIYWQPIYNLLEDRFTLLLVNPQHMKAVPGRKTDVKDSEWIADLLRHGLLRASFVPDRPQRELRELTRYRTSLVEERAAEVNRLQKTLEGGNIKLGSVASSIMGVSARQMLEGLVAGTATPAALADLAQGKLREKLGELEQALTGRFGAHQRFLVVRHLAHVDYLDELIGQVSAEIAERVHPFEETIERLDAIPGVGRIVAEVIVAEIGTEVSRFPSAQHLASWAGLAPGNEESAGKRKSSKTRKGDQALRHALIEAASAAAKKKDSYLQTQYRRLAARRGKKKAAVAVAHSILVIVYHLLKDPERQFTELGANYFDERDQEAVKRRAVRRLERLGLKVTLEPAEAAAA
jgi:transposase